MKKVYKILLIVGAVVVVATPAIFLSVYFGIQNRINETDVSITGISVTDLTDDSLTGAVNFTISDPTSADATFRILSFNVSYDDVLLGSGAVTTDEFSTQIANHTTAFTLAIADETYFSQTFVDDFIDLENITLELDVIIEFTGALAALPQKTITQSADIHGLNGLPVSIGSFELLSVADDELQLEVSALINNPSQITLSINNLYSDIFYTDTFFGNISKDDFVLNKGLNTLEVTTWIGGEKSLLSDFLSAFIGGEVITIDLDLNISLNNFVGEDLKISKLVEDVSVASVEDDLVSIEVQMITLSITGPSSVNYEIHTIITITNPTGIAINITYFDGLVVYDDADGASFSIPFVGTWNYPADTNLTLTPVTFDWSASPLELAPSDSEEDTYVYSDNDVEQGVRLYDEYELKNQLYVSIINGELTLEIDTFEITISVEIFNLHVPN